MADKELYQKGEVALHLVDGDLVIVYHGAGGKVEVSVETDYFLDKLKDVIPGKIDDTVIELLKGALKI